MTHSRRDRKRREARAEKDAAWFYGVLGGTVPEKRSPARERGLAIETALRATTAFHRGALSLWHRKRDWPAALVAEFGPFTSLVVRLECARVPSVGTTEGLEAAAVERLCARIASAGAADEEALDRLALRAHRHYRLAIRALARALPPPLQSEEAPVSGVVVARDVAESA